MTPSFSPPARERTTVRLHKIGLWMVSLALASSTVFSQAATQIPQESSASTGTASAVIQTEQVRNELLAQAPGGIAPGSTVWLGLQLRHQPGWHTYWKNPGDSGLPTVMRWTLPTGVTAGEVVWPTPQRLAVGNLVNYGYEGTVLLPVPLTIGPSFAPTAGGLMEVHLSASWLVCRQECIPQEGDFVLRLPVRGPTALHRAAFEAHRAASPAAFDGAAQAMVSGNALAVTVRGLPASWRNHALQAFPEIRNLTDPLSAVLSASTAGNAASSPGNGTQNWDQDVWTARLPLSAQRDANTDRIPLVLALGTQSLRLVAPISGNWPAASTPGAAGPAPEATSLNNPVAISPSTNAGVPNAGGMALGGSTWVFALATAMLGGLILNLMPCVLPVLAIKVLGFANSGKEGVASRRAQGVAYTLGVVLSFVGLGGLMLGLRAGGEQLGWGFQLQSPAVVAVLAVLFTLLALNLAGLFEVGNMLPQRLASMQVRHPVADAFFSGVLAVAIASPCTAPFMGASLGYAISLPALQALGIFAALGLGLALPFLMAAWVPMVGNWLPRPGAWMDTLRKFMAFPMLATVVWLVWVLGHLSGVDGADTLLALLLTLSLLIWSLNLSGRSRVVFVTLSVAALAGLGATLGPTVLKMDSASAQAPAPGLNGSAGATWQAWAPGKVEAELAAGHPVFVDFTAAWCITCQYNKKTTLGSTEVLGDMRAHQVTLMRADWTRRDPAITRALEQLGRSGVPVYVLHQVGRPPVVFSEILDAHALRATLAKL